jgi:hypothetical protein
MNRRHALVVASVIVLGAGQVALAQVDWTLQELCVAPGAPGTWDTGGHMLGDVVFDGARYHMYLVGGPGTDPLDYPWSVGHWWSDDVAGPWAEDPDNPVLVPTPGAWDGFTIIDFGVWFDGAMLHAWYGAAAVYNGLVNAGHATNPTGFGDWTKDLANPLPGLGPGIPGPWNSVGPTPSTVLFDGATHGMWYTAAEGSTWGAWRIGYAASTDGGLAWTSYPDPVLAGQEPWEGVNVYLPEVVPYGDGFAMWYAGANSTAAVGYAVSPDGIHWGRWAENPVLSPSPGCDRLDSIAVLLEGDTTHAWVANCRSIYHATSPLEVVFFDGFEGGDADVWGTVLP